MTKICSNQLGTKIDQETGESYKFFFTLAQVSMHRKEGRFTGVWRCLKTLWAFSMFAEKILFTFLTPTHEGICYTPRSF